MKKPDVGKDIRTLRTREEFKNLFLGLARHVPTDANESASEAASILSHLSSHQFISKLRMIILYKDAYIYAQGKQEPLQHICFQLEAIQRECDTKTDPDLSEIDEDAIQRDLNEAYEIILPELLQSVHAFVRNLRITPEDLRELPKAINEYEKAEQERTVTFQRMQKSFQDLKDQVESLKTVKPFLAYESDLNEKEKHHQVAICGCLLALTLPISFWILSFSYEPISSRFLQFEDVKNSGSLWIDLLAFVKVLTPSIAALLFCIVLLRFVFKERHNLLMLRQRRDILKLAVSVLKDDPYNDLARGEIFAAISASALAYYSTGYGGKEEYNSAELMELLKKAK